MKHDTPSTDYRPRSDVERSGERVAHAVQAAALLAAIGVCGWLPVQAQCVLGGQPPCEASAALIVDCPDGVGRCLLVGDNEVRRALFVFRLDGHGRPVSGRQVMTLDLCDDDELSDIEAVTRSADGTLLVFGSHSRKSDCDGTKNRRRFGIIQALDPQPIAVTVRQSDKIKCADLFVDDIRDQPLIKAVCKVIDQTEDDAKAVAEDLKNKTINEDEARRRCNAITTYNAEGAVDIAAAGDTPSLWIGLRSPLLPAHPAEPQQRDLALLLHLKDLDAYKFDAVAVLDLDGRGIRDLAIADGWVWLIAGPPQDLSANDAEPFQLRRFRADGLGGDAVIRPEVVRDELPTSSEGLALMDDHAIVVIDGDEGKEDCGGSCAIASRYLLLSLPAPAAATSVGRP